MYHQSDLLIINELLRTLTARQEGESKATRILQYDLSGDGH